MLIPHMEGTTIHTDTQILYFVLICVPIKTLLRDWNV